MNDNKKEDGNEGVDNDICITKVRDKNGRKLKGPALASPVRKKARTTATPRKSTTNSTTKKTPAKGRHT